MNDNETPDIQEIEAALSVREANWRLTGLDAHHNVFRSTQVVVDGVPALIALVRQQAATIAALVAERETPATASGAALVGLDGVNAAPLPQDATDTPHGPSSAIMRMRGIGAEDPIERADTGRDWAAGAQLDEAFDALAADADVQRHLRETGDGLGQLDAGIGGYWAGKAAMP